MAGGVHGKREQEGLAVVEGDPSFEAEQVARAARDPSFFEGGREGGREETGDIST